MIFNLSGQAIPAVAGVFAIPPLIAGLGTSRFGILTLAWIAVGYFSLFDLGMGRALTKLVAERIGTDQERDVATLAQTALALMLVFGAVGAIIGILVTPWLVGEVLRIPLELQTETKYAFRLLALSLPLVITSAGLRGLLEGMHQFGWVNAIRIPIGVFTFIGPLLALPFSTSLVAVVAVLIAVRAIAWFAYLICCVKLAPDLLKDLRSESRLVPLLLEFGGWMTVTNIIGPLMIYMDRLLIGAIVSAAAVAYYATPYEVVTKMWLIPGAMLGVLLPAFSAGFRQDPEWVRQKFNRSAQLLLLILFPVAFLIILFAREGLTLWLGSDFATQSATVAKWLAAGVFVNSLAMIPFTLIQGAGRPDLTAKLHVIELAPYLVGLWWFTTLHGIDGAAVMWTLRAGCDFVLLYTLAISFLPRGAIAVHHTLAAVAVAVAALVLAALPTSIPAKLAYATIMLLITGVVAWKALGARTWLISRLA
jgi:O-antigen/teichoic acid export membrane protein